MRKKIFDKKIYLNNYDHNFIYERSKVHVNVKRV